MIHGYRQQQTKQYVKKLKNITSEILEPATITTIQSTTNPLHNTDDVRLHTTSLSRSHRSPWRHRQVLLPLLTRWSRSRRLTVRVGAPSLSASLSLSLLTFRPPKTSHFSIKKANRDLKEALHLSASDTASTSHEETPQLEAAAPSKRKGSPRRWRRLTALKQRRREILKNDKLKAPIDERKAMDKKEKTKIK